MAGMDYKLDNLRGEAFQECGHLESWRGKDGTCEACKFEKDNAHWRTKPHRGFPMQTDAWGYVSPYGFRY